MKNNTPSKYTDSDGGVSSLIRTLSLLTNKLSVCFFCREEKGGDREEEEEKRDEVGRRRSIGGEVELQDMSASDSFLF